MNRLSSCLLFQQRVYSNISIQNMSGQASLSLKEVVTKLNAFAPLSLAESWDNVGLLIEPATPRAVKRILLTNDLTERVLNEALTGATDLIISYHPPIFAPLKRITQNNWKERIVSKCLENRIALYSPHTAWDAVHGGVNDWLGSFLTIQSSAPISPNADDPQRVGAGRILTLTQGERPLTLSDVIERFKKHIHIEHVNVAYGCDSDLQTSVETVALCAGSGGSVLKGVKADLYITGEMSHHDVLDAMHRNVSVIVCNHSNSERGFLGHFKEILSEKIGCSAEIVVAESDADPLLVH